MRIIEANLIQNSVKEMVREALCSLTCSGKEALSKALKNETNENAKFALEMIKENALIAEKNGYPICQDTGMAVFYVKIGQDVFVEGNISDAINEGVRQSYTENGFRFSVLDPITRINTKDNTPAIIHIEFVKGDKLEISFLPKGFGSENMSRLYMLLPSAGIDGVIESVVDCVKIAGSNPCPPIVVGVGIGGTAEKAMEVAKYQLFREVGMPSSDEQLASLEKIILDKINALDIGAQGFHGNTTAFAVHIGKYPTHISALPVAVNIQCNAIRTREIII
jgi:fumarate hydratase subunit alpha